MSRYRFAAGLVAIAVIGVACGEDEPPALPNPPGITALVTQFSAAVNTTPMQSLAALTRPMLVFGVNLANLAGPLLGKTIEWNVTTDVVDTTARAGAPAAATRVILYTINPLTLRPVEPLVEVGYVDLFPHSNFPDSSSIRFLVTGTTGGTTVVGDFLAHAHENASDAAQVNGFVTNGTERLDFVLPYVKESDSHTTLVTDFDLSAPATRIHHRSALPNTTDTTLATDLTFTFEGQQVLSLSSPVAVSSAGAVTGTGSTGVNGAPFATWTITATGSLTITGPGGRAPTAEESAAITAMHALAMQLALFVEFPVLRLYGCGC